MIVSRINRACMGNPIFQYCSVSALGKGRIAIGSLLKLDKITKEYTIDSDTVTALHEVSLTVEAGEFVAITGQSGSGKSTLMNILGCLDRPTRGTYLLNGQDVFSLTDAQRTALRGSMLGFIFQGYNLIPTLTCLENVELPLLYTKLSAKQRRQRALAALEQVGLGNRLSHLPHQLSGGQQQRTAIARTIAFGPSCILADEPTGNLDSASAQSVLALLRSLNAQGNTIILITHDPRIAADAPRVLQIENGFLTADRQQAAQ